MAETALLAGRARLPSLGYPPTGAGPGPVAPNP